MQLNMNCTITWRAQRLDAFTVKGVYMSPIRECPFLLGIQTPMWHVVTLPIIHVHYIDPCLQCNDAGDLASGRASGLEKRWGIGVVICLKQGVDCLHMVQLMPLLPKTPSSLASFKSRLILSFWYRLTQVVLKKRPSQVFRPCLKDS